MSDDSNRVKRQNPTIFDIAREAGVSYSTVSRVLNGFSPLKESTRERVLEAANRLGYVANVQARSLAGGRTNVIGVLVPSMDSGYGYIGEMMRGIDRELERADYDVMMFSARRQVGKESLYVRTIASRLTDGLILVTPLMPSDYLDALQERDFPYVLLDQSDSSGKSSLVMAANWQGGYDATSFLIKQGHTRIAIITGAMVIQSAADRLEGYKAALNHHNIPYLEELMVPGDFSHASGYAATHQLLNLSPRPTAIFASNDFEAFGAIEALRERGLQIPADMSIIGFDNIRLASIAYPKLTTIEQPLEQMGSTAVRLLLEQIENPQRPPQQITLATQLIVRDSCSLIIER